MSVSLVAQYIKMKLGDTFNLNLTTSSNVAYS